MRNEIKISVIIVNWNGRHVLQECLHSLEGQTFNKFETILVDNNSADDSKDIVKKYYPKVNIISLEKNMGFCYANNFALKSSKGAFVSLLNNDTKAEPNWLCALYKEIIRDKKIGICASKIVRYDNPNILDTTGDCYDVSGVGFRRGHGQLIGPNFAKSKEVFGACAAAALYRKTMLEEIGFFDDDFFAVGEDIDLSFRAKMAGFECVYVPAAIVRHKVSKTIGAGSDFQVYQARRNVEYVYFKNMPFALVVLTLPLHLLYNFLTAIHDITKGQIGIFIKAKQDFLKNFGRTIEKRKEIQGSRKISLTALLGSFSKNYLWLRLKEGTRNFF